jgi:hypothetical protein
MVTVTSEVIFDQLWLQIDANIRVTSVLSWRNAPGNPQLKIQYLPDGVPIPDSIKHTLAPTRRRRKAGVGRISPLSNACHLP